MWKLTWYDNSGTAYDIQGTEDAILATYDVLVASGLRVNVIDADGDRTGLEFTPDNADRG